MTCAKKTVIAVIQSQDGKVLGVGSNACLKPQTECPRGPDEGYLKCRTICQQVGHAETVAISNAIDDGHDLIGARCMIIGHHRVCDDCWVALAEHGIEEVIHA